MALGLDIRRGRRICWLPAVYAGEHGVLKVSCHIVKDGILCLSTVNIDWQVRHGTESIIDLAGAGSGSHSL